MKAKATTIRSNYAAAAPSPTAAQSWQLLILILQLLLPYLVIQFFVGAETSVGTPLPGWVWLAAFFILLFWLVYQLERIFLLDLKRSERLAFAPKFLKGYRLRAALPTLLRLAFFYVPILAAVRTFVVGYHAGLTAMASLYLGLGLYGLLTLVARRRAWHRWLRQVWPDEPGAVIQPIDTFAQIAGVGTYVLTNYPAWVICIFETRGGYRAAVQVEAIEGAYPVGDAHGRPKTVKHWSKLVREMVKVDGVGQAAVDEILGRLGVRL